MKKLYYSLLRGKVISAFLIAYMVIFICGAVFKLLSFGFGYGDVFYSFLNFMRDIGMPDPHVNTFASFFMFLGSFYGVILFPLFYLFLAFIKAAFIQMVLHIFVKKPKRFSTTLAIFFTVIAFAYVISFVPFIGKLLFGLTVIYLAAKEISKQNSFALWRGVLLMFSPLILSGIVILLFFISAAGMVSFF
ncbi:MAG: hypothetical protein V1647_05185 [Pseudomonadota bacterium]